MEKDKRYVCITPEDNMQMWYDQDSPVSENLDLETPEGAELMMQNMEEPAIRHWNTVHSENSWHWESNDGMVMTNLGYVMTEGKWHKLHI